MTWGTITWNVGNYGDIRGLCDECGHLISHILLLNSHWCREQVSAYSYPALRLRVRALQVVAGVETELWLIQSFQMLDAYFILILIMGVLSNDSGPLSLHNIKQIFCMFWISKNIVILSEHNGPREAPANGWEMTPGIFIMRNVRQYNGHNSASVLSIQSSQISTTWIVILSILLQLTSTLSTWGSYSGRTGLDYKSSMSTGISCCSLV